MPFLDVNVQANSYMQGLAVAPAFSHRISLWYVLSKLFVYENNVTFEAFRMDHDQGWSAKGYKFKQQKEKQKQKKKKEGSQMVKNGH